MNGKTQPVTEWFADLSAEDQIRFLLGLAPELTIVARAYYVPQESGLSDPAAVRAVNEIQHRVTAHARNILSDIKVFCKKQKHQPVTIYDFATYMSIPLEQIIPYMV